MRFYKRYLVQLVVLLSLANVLMAFFGQKSMEIYLVSDFIIFILVSLVSLGQNRQATRALNPIIITFSLGYLAFKVIEVLNTVGAIHLAL